MGRGTSISDNQVQRHEIRVKLGDNQLVEAGLEFTVEAVGDAVQKNPPSVVHGRHDDAQAGKGSAGEDDDATSERESTIGEADGSSSTKGKHNIVEKMFTMGVVDESGVQTKYITRNCTFPTVQRRDHPDNVGSSKAQRYLETDWDTIQENPAFNLLTEYKSNVFRPDLPEGLPEKRETEHRIDVKDPNLVIKNLSGHAAPTFCVRKPVGWRIVHDYQYLNSNTVRQSIPMTRKEDILDAMFGAYWFSTMDLMSAYYQVRMREEDIKFIAFQAPNGPWEYRVLPMGDCNAPATMRRLPSKLFRDLKSTKSFYDDIYVFTKSSKIEDHLDALREKLDILRDNKLYVKLSKCVVCADEIPCLGDFVGRDGVRMA
ncbi:unnamed protein product [Phytophthora fragariaefolia]|uniref:Unnamed protein product n=1 Tax=Phytophthora fragariaefolia TaxID=1490495 RepID=A0A9W6XDZ8_9STRA|nr:unnamed protein product [Phytophthora fragariaefolia]